MSSPQFSSRQHVILIACGVIMVLGLGILAIDKFAVREGEPSKADRLSRLAEEFDLSEGDAEDRARLKKLLKPVAAQSGAAEPAGQFLFREDQTHTLSEQASQEQAALLEKQTQQRKASMEESRKRLAALREAQRKELDAIRAQTRERRTKTEALESDAVPLPGDIVADPETFRGKIDDTIDSIAFPEMTEDAERLSD